MSELTDDQLDGLFRKSAEEFDPPFDPAAWQDMKNRLDTHDGNPSGGLLPVWTNMLRWGLPLILLLLLTGGGWYAYTRMTPSESVTKPPVSPTNAGSRATQPQVTEKQERGADQLAVTDPVRTNVADLPTAPVNEDKQPVILAEPATASGVPDKRLNKPVSRAREPERALTASATKRIESAYKAKPEVNRATTSRFSASGTVTAKRASSNRPSGRLEVGSLSAQKQTRMSRKRKKMALSEMSYLMPSVALNSSRPVGPVNQKLGQISPAETTGNVPAPVVEQTESVSLPALSALRIRPAHWPALSPLASRPVVAQPDTAARRIVPKSNADRGLSVRFVVAPDLSSIGLKNFSRPGTNVGLLLEYRLASRWSVQAGVIQSTKVYRALPNEYTPTGGYVHVKPISIDGHCIMFDIPINLRYDIVIRPGIAGRQPSRWFVSGGVTSYIIRQEDYTNNFADPNDPNIYPSQKQPVSERTGGYGFSNLNLSIGYERALSRRLSWQIEPFIKAPLKGVGFYKTNLLSTGAFFSIRYKF